MEERAKELQVVPFVNANSKVKRARETAVIAIIAKVVFLVLSVTMAMLLISSGNMIGYAIYAKEIIEFIVFVVYAVRRSRR